MGMGVMSGRASGFCAGFGMPGYAYPGPGRGHGMGFGRGQGVWNRGFDNGTGWRHWYHSTGQPGWRRFGECTIPFGYPAPYAKPDPELEKQALKNHADALQSELDSIRKRLAEVEGRNTAE